MTGIVFQNESPAVLAPQTIANITLQDDPDVVLIQDTSGAATIQTGIVLVGSSGSITGPGGQAVSGNVPQWANSQGTALGPGLGVGTNPSNLVQLDGSARLPAVDGSQLINTPKTAFVFSALVGGRLSLATGTPVMASTVAGASAIYYTPYIGECAPITFDGVTWTFVDLGGELSQALSDTTKSLAAAAPSSIYDMFLWWDPSTSVYRCTRGPAWANSTTRSLALSSMRGLQVNSAAIANGPAANFGLWVGTIATNTSGTVDFIYGSGAAGGGAASFGVWNTFNRVSIRTMVQSTTTSWTYATATNRPVNGSNTYRVTWVQGAREDGGYASYQCLLQTSNQSYISLAVDSTTATTGIQGYITVAASTTATLRAETALNLGIGQHYVQAMEEAVGGTVTYLGGADGGLIAMLRL